MRKIFALMAGMVGAFALATPAIAAPVSFNVSGNIVFTSSENTAGLQSGVEAAVLAALADGTALSGRYVVDLAVADSNPDPAVGVYQPIITAGQLNVAGFGFEPSSFACVNAAFDCREQVQNDGISLGGGQFLDSVQLLTGFLSSQALTQNVIAASGAVSNSPFLDLTDAPITANLGLSVFAADLVDNDGIVDPAAIGFEKGGMAITLASVFNQPGGSAASFARFNFEIQDLVVSASVPLPASAPLLLAGLGILLLTRKRRQSA